MDRCIVGRRGALMARMGLDWVRRGLGRIWCRRSGLCMGRVIRVAVGRASRIMLIIRSSRACRRGSSRGSSRTRRIRGR